MVAQHKYKKGAPAKTEEKGNKGTCLAHHEGTRSKADLKDSKAWAWCVHCFTYIYTFLNLLRAFYQRKLDLAPTHRYPFRAAFFITLFHLFLFYIHSPRVFHHQRIHKWDEVPFISSNRVC